MPRISQLPSVTPTVDAIIPVTQDGNTGRIPASGLVTDLPSYTAGTGATARSVQARMRDLPVMVSDFGATGNGVTDDRAAVQAALNFAVANGSRRVQFGPGTFLINGTLEIKPSSGFYAVELRGADGSFLGMTRLVHHSSQKINPLLAIQSTRSVLITDIRFNGNNVAPSNGVTGENWINGDPTAWVSAGIQEARYAPYCAICVDGLSGTDPGAGSNYTYGTYLGAGFTSSQICIERCRLENFLADVVVNPTVNATGTENIIVRDTQFVESKFAVVTCATQQREVQVINCTFAGHWCQFDNVTFGSQEGPPITVQGGIHGKAYRLVQLSTAVGVSAWFGGYCENVASIGILGTASSSSYHGVCFYGTNFSMIGADFTGTTVNKDIPIRANMPVLFSGCDFVLQFNLLVATTKGVVFDSCNFRCENTGTDTTPGEAENFSVYTPAGSEHLLELRNCSQRVYSGTAKYLNDRTKLASLPSRAYLMANCFDVLVQTGRVQYKVVPPSSEARTATITSVSYASADEVTFTETTGTKIIRPGDQLIWRVNLPVTQGEAATTAFLPALRVKTVNSGTGAVTCKVITHDIDTTYSPANVDIKVRLFIRSLTSTGDFTNGSATVTNVTNMTGLQVNDWIYHANGTLVNPLRIDAIDTGAGTITLHRTANTTVAGLTFANSTLTAI